MKYGCSMNFAGKEICINLIFTFCGYDWEQFNYTLLPDIMKIFPTGGSANTVIHYSQVFQSGKFRQYDYGRTKNLLTYDSAEPPDYNLANIMVSIAIFYGPGDTMIDIMDVKRLSCALPNVMDVYEVPWPNFNHMDFIWAKDASKLVYERVLKIMRKENPNNITSAMIINDECYTLNL
ncbi:lipase 3 [Lasius niger]|uniref:Lipase 3 n=1 Tax=Lasius niger TaxID=67767 RepID=A0A0J7N2W5_LASNI|nr:lipase 3 [Lasius niger]